MTKETKQIILRTGAGTPTTLAEAELGFATDTKTLFVGTGNGNVKILEEKGHTHTKSNITDFAHEHDDRYYTETEMNTLLSEKASITHGHTLNYNYFYIGQATSSGEHDFAAINDYQDFFINIQVDWADGNMIASGVVSNHHVGVVNANIFDTLSQAMCYLSASVGSGQLRVNTDGQMPWSMVTGETKNFSISLYGVKIQ